MISAIILGWDILDDKFLTLCDTQILYLFYQKKKNSNKIKEQKSCTISNTVKFMEIGTAKKFKSIAL